MSYKTRSIFQAHPFHLVNPSPWPLTTSFSLFSLTTSAAMTMHGFVFAYVFFFFSLFSVIYSMSLWFRDVISEGTYLGNHTLAVQRGLNIGVGLFILSEALFFLAIFWAFFHSALSPNIELGAEWPPMGIQAINPFELPLLNTVKCAIKIFYHFDVAVWVKYPLYMFSFSINFYLVLFSLLLPLLINYNYLSKKTKYLLNKRFISNIKEEEFYKWFVGFSDAEGSFGIFIPTEGISFKYAIGLHIDDLPTLNFIKNKLGFGTIYLYKNSCSFIVMKKEDILKLILIFDKYKLNSTKYLDFLDFKKAFYLYNERINLSEELKDKIVELKNNMNNQRINFTLPTGHKIILSKSWLLGFIEGDGSFSLNRNTLEPIFSIKLAEYQLPLLMEIKKFLVTNLGFDTYSIHKLNSSSIISIGKGKAISNSKPIVTFLLKNIHVLNNYFVPFFNKFTFIKERTLS
jgi:hypothetical protein